MLSVDQVREYPLLDGLNDAELAHLAQVITRRSFAKGAYVYYPGSPGTHVYLIESGMVRQFYITASGQEMIITWTGPPEVFGLPSPEDNQLRVVGAATLQPSVFLVIARSVFFDLLYSSPRFVRNVYRELFIASRKMLLNTRALTTLDLNGRLATMLLRQATKGTNQEQIVRLPITQEALAGWLGASRGRLNQAMQLFQQRGLISIDGQNITILDYPGLVRMSEEQTAEEV